MVLTSLLTLAKPQVGIAKEDCGQGHSISTNRPNTNSNGWLGWRRNQSRIQDGGTKKAKS